MTVSDIADAQTQLLSLIQKATSGDEVIISQNNKPIAKIVPITSNSCMEPRVPGAWKGKVWMAPDFDETPQELIDLMENGEIFPPVVID